MIYHIENLIFKVLLLFFIILNNFTSFGQNEVDNYLDLKYLNSHFQFRINFDDEFVRNKINNKSIIIYKAKNDYPIKSNELDTIFSQIDSVNYGFYDTIWNDYVSATAYTYCKFVAKRCEFYYFHRRESGYDTLYMGFYVNEDDYDELFYTAEQKVILKIWKLKKINKINEWTVNSTTPIEIFEIIQKRISEKMKFSKNLQERRFFSGGPDSIISTNDDSAFCVCKFNLHEELQKSNSSDFMNPSAISYVSIVDLEGGEIKINKICFHFANSMIFKGLYPPSSKFCFNRRELKRILGNDLNKIFWVYLNSSYHIY